MSVEVKEDMTNEVEFYNKILLDRVIDGNEEEVSLVMQSVDKITEYLDTKGIVMLPEDFEFNGWEVDFHAHSKCNKYCLSGSLWNGYINFKKQN